MTATTARRISPWDPARSACQRPLAGGHCTAGCRLLNAGESPGGKTHAPLFRPVLECSSCSPDRTPRSAGGGGPSGQVHPRGQVVDVPGHRPELLPPRAESQRSRALRAQTEREREARGDGFVFFLYFALLLSALLLFFSLTSSAALLPSSPVPSAPGGRRRDGSETPQSAERGTR